MQKPKGQRSTIARKHLSNSEAGRNAAIDWEWLALFTNDLRFLMEGVDWRHLHSLGKAASTHGMLESQRSFHDMQCIMASYSRIAPLVMYLKESELLILEANKIARIEAYREDYRNHKISLKS